jgi:hypothetical protein
VLRTALATLAALAAAILPAGAQALVPSDPLVTSWAYAAANLPAAWDVETGSGEVAVAILDSGVDASHPDLAGGVLPGHDFVDADSDATDVLGHGTAVAGIAAARGDNGLGAAGACWMCRILPLRVLGLEGFARLQTIATAVDYAVENGAAVINVSLYGENRNGALEAAIARARASGVLVVAAAGNEGNSTPEYPAAYSEAVGVAATDESGGLASYSSRGSWVKLAAPGCTPTTLLGGGFGAGCGTSGAAPVVAGVIALMRSRAPYATASQIEAALAETARPLGGVRFGRVDAFAALQRLGIPPPTLEPSVEGVALPGATLTAHSGVWSGAELEVSYRWERCRDEGCDAVGDARTYVVGAADGGARLRVRASASGAQSAVSAATEVVPTRPRSVSPPTISGRALVGARLVGATGAWSGGGPYSFGYRWTRCRDAACTRVTGVGSARTYRVREADRGRWLRLTVIAANAAGRMTASSPPTRRIR